MRFRTCHADLTLLAAAVLCLAFSPVQALSSGSGPAYGGAVQSAHFVRGPALPYATEGMIEAQASGATEAGATGLPIILRSEESLPEPVREMRRQLIEAASSGDIEQLRALMNAQPEPPSVSFGDPVDPIDYLKALSSDAEGREI